MLFASCRIRLAFAAALCMATATPGEDRPQWGERHTRNMVSSETGLPVNFDPTAGAGVKWSAPLGSNAYGTPTVANSKVFIGANNEKPRDPRIQGDRGVLLCLNESDGSLVWQLTTTRTGGDDYLDWPKIASCTPPTIEGNKVYFLTNRFQVVCLDIDGQANGNDGVFQDEGKHAMEAGQPPIEMTPADADILWLTDLPGAAGIYTHDAAQTSILIDGDYLYLNSCNGVDNTHRLIRKPEAPSLIVLDKKTGKLLAHDAEGIAPLVIHATWSPPALGRVNGQKRIFFGGPDGVAYAFEPLPSPPPAALHTIKRVWRFDCDPTAPKTDVHSYQGNRKESRSAIESMPVFYKKRLYITVGGDIWWGKRQSWLKCIDATKAGDITTTGEIWSYEMKHHCSTTPAILNGLVFVADCDGFLHCVDAETGAPYWTHEVGGEIWGSPLAADGKVYVGSIKRNFCVLAASKEKELLSSVKFPENIASTPVAANGVLYVNTLDTLYALK
jgi:outer membrane protein assembly factor BamB